VAAAATRWPLFSGRRRHTLASVQWPPPSAWLLCRSKLSDSSRGHSKLAALLVAAGMHKTLMMAIACAAFHLNIMSNLIINFKLKQ
jgi:hypothetical protein